MLFQAVAAAMISMATDRIVRRLTRADRKCCWHLEVKLVRRPKVAPDAPETVWGTSSPVNGCADGGYAAGFADGWYGDPSTTPGNSPTTHDLRRR